MLDIKFIRNNPDIVKEGCQKKQVKVDIDRILKLDKERRDLIKKRDELRAQHRDTSSIVARDVTGPGPISIKIEKGREEREEIKNYDEKLKEIEKELQDLMLQVPIPPAPDVPEGKTEEDNVPVKFWGKLPKFNFSPKDYITLMESLDLLDLKRGTKIGGFRQYVIKNEAVLLEQVLLRWSLDYLIKKGFIPFRPTVMVKEFAMTGTGMFPRGREDTYVTSDDLFLAGTTEVPLMAYHANEILEEKELPKKYVGISEAFRREVGSYGKDVKGIFRVHEFWQTEQVIICKNDEKKSIKWHEELLKNSEELMQALDLPYRVVNCCAGDLADGQVKRYDIEAWIPSQKRYRETHSDSYLFDFQTRRLNIRYRTKDGKIKFAHSLNDTGIAVPRILAAIIENYQRKDGKINVPKVLQKYLPFKVIKR
ncbi:serine--tRNA ligase [Patescibacteria group bacterium]|nr:serine--tRNA ligase [Patescibacteria group bacterium]